MPDVRLTLACGDYDLWRPLIEGAVRPGGIELTCVTMPSPERHWRMARHEEFDLCELSMGAFLADSSRSRRFAAIPVFPHRRFRHSYVFVNTAAGITKPAELVGKRVGLRTVLTTASLWVRGMLEHEYGVPRSGVHWFTAAEEGVDGFRPLFPVQRIGTDESIDDMLVRGDLDAVIYPEVLPSFRHGSPSVARLFPDYKPEEQAYFRRTGIFPIMHTVVAKASVLERFPWVAVNLLQAFEESKAAAYRRTRDPRSICLAWAMHALAEQTELMGPDSWASGLARNRPALETLMQYAVEEGLIPEDLSLEELFAASTLEDVPRYDTLTQDLRVTR